MKGLLTKAGGVDCHPALFSHRAANDSSIRVPTKVHACFLHRA